MVCSISVLDPFVRRLSVKKFVKFAANFLPRDATQSAVLRLHVVCLSVRDVVVCFPHRLEYFENNFTAE